ncbi:MAG TPA: hypothetical protein VIL44_03550, partial [Micromonospora sp.]
MSITFDTDGVVGAVRLLQRHLGGEHVSGHDAERRRDLRRGDIPGGDEGVDQSVAQRLRGVIDKASERFADHRSPFRGRYVSRLRAPRRLGAWPARGHG